MRILRGKCMSASSSSNIHRVKVSVEGVCDNMLMDVSNGIYLRNGDEVFVLFEDDFNSPLVLGRCSGQLELQEIVNILNKLIDVVNADKSAFEKHGHILDATNVAKVISPSGPCTITPGIFPIASTPKDTATGLTDVSFGNKLDKVEIDDLLY